MPTHQTLAAVAEAKKRHGPDSIRNYIVSNTTAVSDLLEVYLLLKEVGLFRPGAQPTTDIFSEPLFETIGDLRAAPGGKVAGHATRAQLAGDLEAGTLLLDADAAISLYGGSSLLLRAATSDLLASAADLASIYGGNSLALTGPDAVLLESTDDDLLGQPLGDPLLVAEVTD